MKAAASLVVLLLAAALVLAGCGGGGGTSMSTSATAASPATTSATSTERASATAQTRAAGTGKASGLNGSHHDAGEDSIQGFGAQASASLRAQAASSLHAYLDSRPRGDWATACRYMSARLIAENAQFAAGSSRAHKGCATIMAAIYSSVPAANFRDAAIAAVGSFRVKGKRGLLLYRGSHHVYYAMPMVHEGGRWKVALASPDPLN